MVEIKIDLAQFSKARELIEFIAKGAKKVADLPVETRRKYMETANEAMSLLDQGLCTVIGILTDLQNEDDFGKYKRRLSKIDSGKKWMTLEKDIRLCFNIRKTMNEFSQVFNDVAAKIALPNQKETQEFFKNLVVRGEAQLADVISESLRNLAQASRSAKSPEELNNLRQLTWNAIDLFKDERNKLITAEAKILDSIGSLKP